MESNATEQKAKPNVVFSSKAKQEFYLFIRQLIKMVTIMILLGLAVMLSKSYSPWVVIILTVAGSILILATAVYCIIHLVRCLIYTAKRI